MRLVLLISLSILVITVAVLAILWGAGVFSSPATSVIPIASTTPMPSPISLITLTPTATTSPAATILPIPTMVLTWTVTPTVAPSPSPVATIMPTLIPGGGGGGGGGSLPIVTPSPVPTPVPTPTPTPRLPANPTRDLPSTVEQGQSFDVTVSFVSPYNEFRAIGMEDIFPVGWIAQIDKEWCSPNPELADIKDSTVRHIWFGPYILNTEFTVVYNVTVPEDAPLGLYIFSGQIRYYIAYEGSIAETISGDSQITVISP